MRVLFLTRSLDRGGAERQLVTLANGLAGRGHTVAVATLYSGGALEGELRGVQLVGLEKRGRWDLAGFLDRLRVLIDSWRPDVVHPYLLVPNVLATLVCRFAAAAPPVVWGVRESRLLPETNDWLVRLCLRASGLLSRLAALIIVNSHAGREHYLSLGYPADRIHVVPNGVDVARFRGDADSRQRVRGEWGIGAGESLVGVVARLDPTKDHEGFLKAARLLVDRGRQWRFVCAGGDPASERGRELRALAGELGLEARVLWPGERGDVEAVYSALDVLVSSSLAGEGFSNSIAEAMACGVPCVVTNVGDSARIVGDAGVVVPPGDPARLAAGVEEALRRGGDLGERARGRVEREFAVERLLDATEELLERLL